MRSRQSWALVATVGSAAVALAALVAPARLAAQPAATKPGPVRAGGFDLSLLGSAGLRAIRPGPPEVRPEDQPEVRPEDQPAVRPQNPSDKTPTSPARGLEIVERSGRKVIVVPDDLLDSRKLGLSSRRSKEIGEFAARLNQNAKWSYQIVGPLKPRDRRKDAGQRWLRSAERALKIARQLVAAGVYPDRLLLVGDASPAEGTIELRVVPRRN